MTKAQSLSGLMIVLSFFLLAACARVAEPVGTEQSAPVVQEESPKNEPVASPEAVATATTVSEEAILVPTVESAPEPETNAVDWTQTAGVDGDYYILGNPAAPIRLIDFSDFM